MKFLIGFDDGIFIYIFFYFTETSTWIVDQHIYWTRQQSTSYKEMDICWRNIIAKE